MAPKKSTSFNSPLTAAQAISAAAQISEQEIAERVLDFDLTFGHDLRKIAKLSERNNRTVDAENDMYRVARYALLGGTITGSASGLAVSGLVENLEPLMQQLAIAGGIGTGSISGVLGGMGAYFAKHSDFFEVSRLENMNRLMTQVRTEINPVSGRMEPNLFLQNAALGEADKIITGLVSTAGDPKKRDEFCETVLEEHYIYLQATFDSIGAPELEPSRELVEQGLRWQNEFFRKLEVAVRADVLDSDTQDKFAELTEELCELNREWIAFTQHIDTSEIASVDPRFNHRFMSDALEERVSDIPTMTDHEPANGGRITEALRTFRENREIAKTLADSPGVEPDPGTFIDNR